jgi:succinate--hydroxymethylglutarate CoA-transferase
VSQPPAGALAGVRVLDLTRILAGPACTMLLGDLGAEVIKVEPPGKGDDTRAWGPPFLGGESAYFLGANRNKRSMTLDTSSAAGKEILGSLIEKCDVLVENFKTGTLARWGFTDAWREQHAPRAVHCSITGYGTTGPKAHLPGYDFILQAESGLMSICGAADGEPMKYGVAIVDLVTGLLASNAILAALQARHQSGRGQRVEVSLYDSSLYMLANVASNYLASGKDARRFGNGHPNIVPYTTFAAQDGMIAVAVGNDAQFAKFAAALSHPEWGEDARFARNQDRVANRDAVETLIGTVLGTDTVDAWIARLMAAGIPCGRVNSVAQALNDPHTAARDMVRTIEHAAAGEIRTVGPGLRMGGTPTSIRRAPPTLGQHTGEILLDELGYAAERVAQLRRDGVV